MIMQLAADPANVNAGWLGLIVIASLAVACVFLYRSMTKQLRKVPPSFERPPEPPPGEEADPPSR